MFHPTSHAGYQQNDAHEFYLSLLENLAESFIETGQFLGPGAEAEAEGEGEASGVQGVTLQNPSQGLPNARGPAGALAGSFGNPGGGLGGTADPGMRVGGGEGGILRVDADVAMREAGAGSRCATPTPGIQPVGGAWEGGVLPGGGSGMGPSSTIATSLQQQQLLLTQQLQGWLQQQQQGVGGATGAGVGAGMSGVEGDGGEQQQQRGQRASASPEPGRILRGYRGCVG